jgi:hypothetical protein
LSSLAVGKSFAKALAMRKCLKFAKNMFFLNLIVESDGGSGAKPSSTIFLLVSSLMNIVVILMFVFLV